MARNEFTYLFIKPFLILDSNLRGATVNMSHYNDQADSPQVGVSLRSALTRLNGR